MELRASLTMDIIYPSHGGVGRLGLLAKGSLIDRNLLLQYIKLRFCQSTHLAIETCYLSCFYVSSDNTKGSYFYLFLTWTEFPVPWM